MEEFLIIEELKKLCERALKIDEVPVAALIVENEKIIAEGYNMVKKTNNCMKHAEIIAIERATKYKKNWRLDNCTLYVTLEPCNMCKEIIKKSRIKNIIYYSKQNEYNTEKEPIYINENNIYFSNMLSDFFKSKR